MKDVFCRIIDGEIPSTKVYEDDDVLAILDISQTTKGHTLVIPKKHYDNFLACPLEAKPWKRSWPSLKESDRLKWGFLVPKASISSLTSEKSLDKASTTSTSTSSLATSVAKADSKSR